MTDERSIFDITMTSGYFDLPINMDRACRICLTEGNNLSPIFSTNQEVNNSGLPQKIQVCGSIEIHEQDGLPSLICDICIYKATVAHDFRQQCQHSDAKLRAYYNKPAKCNITVNIILSLCICVDIYNIYAYIYHFLGFLYTNGFTNEICTIEKAGTY